MITDAASSLVPGETPHCFPFRDLAQQSAIQPGRFGHIGHDRYAKGAAALTLAAGNTVRACGCQRGVMLAHARRNLAAVEPGDIQVFVDRRNINGHGAGLAMVTVDATALHIAPPALEHLGVVFFRFD